MTTALMVLLVYFYSGQLKTSIVAVPDMNVCHDLRKEVDTKLRVFNEAHEKPQQVRQWTAICVDLSAWTTEGIPTRWDALKEP